jgi:restriction endonuclease S subunit
LEGLDITVLRLSEVGTNNDKFRIDAGYFAKLPVLTEGRIEALPHMRLGAVCSVFRKGLFDIKASSYAEVGVPFVRIGNIRNGLIDSNDIALITPKSHAAEGNTALKFGDIVLSKTAYAAAAFVNLPDCNVSQDTIALRLSSYGRTQFKSGYIVAYLNSRYGLALMSRQFQGNVQEHLSLPDGQKILVPLFNDELQSVIDQAIRDAHEHLRIAHEGIGTSEVSLVAALGIGEWNPPEPLAYTRKASEVLAANRVDAEFHRPKVDALFCKLASTFNLRNLGELGVVENGQTVLYDENGTIPIIRSGDLSDIDDDSRFLRTDSSTPIFKLKRGDVLVSSIGFGSIGKIQVFDKAGTYGTVSEVTVIRQNEMNPYYLASFLRSRFGQMQIDRYITGATGQLHLYKRDVRKFFLPEIPDHEQKRFELLAREAFEARAQARTSLEKAKRAVEIAIEDSEAAALKYLKQSRTIYACQLLARDPLASANWAKAPLARSAGSKAPGLTRKSAVPSGVSG